MAVITASNITTSMSEPHQTLTQKQLGLPPSPPATETDPGSRTESVTDFQIGEPTPSPEHRNYPLPPESRASQRVLPEDLRTPDKHVPRDPRLLRLTGVHPFNVEAPLTDLWGEGFITTKDLHYVRNHGAVPLVHDEDVLDWSFSVEGLVENPLSLTLRDLLAGFEQVTYPVTLVCAGNRRKEQNVVRKTKGFSWGPAGLSTALWTGVPLDVLLARARPVVRGKKRARYVCFEGADKLPNGYYGTSIKLNWATDPNRGIMVAHGMNGEVLPPDHGKPLRIVIPGQIGGRSVKWLRRIIVTEGPSDNWYHIYDNRVLPTTVGPEESADLPEVWKDERYAIYDLNTNSAVARPAHNERVDITTATTNTFKFQGYAYAGGGRRVTRVELTLDRGRSWRLADMSYPEDEYRLAPEGETLFGGRLDVSWRESCFCWCFWSLEVPFADLLAGGCGDVMVRAMDDAMMVQPRDLYWSVLGMMNNPWFRVVVHREEEGGGVLRFEHPTVPILNVDGWMDRVKKEGGDLTNGFWGEKAPGEGESAVVAVQPVKEISLVNKDVKREISLGELKDHEGEEEPWFVLDGEVYDGTRFLEGHPGGAASIIGAAGQDVVEEFMAIRKSEDLSPSICQPRPLTHHTRNRQRERKSNDAFLPHRHPLRNIKKDPRGGHLRRSNRLGRRTAPDVPPPKDMEEGAADEQDPHKRRHKDLHLFPGPPLPVPGPPDGPAPHGAPAGPCLARGHHPRVYPPVGQLVREGEARRAGQDLSQDGDRPGRDDDAGARLDPAGPLGRVQGPRGEVRVPRAGQVRRRWGEGEDGEAVRDGLRGERGDACLCRAPGGDEGGREQGRGSTPAVPRAGREPDRGGYPVPGRDGRARGREGGGEVQDRAHAQQPRRRLGRRQGVHGRGAVREGGRPAGRGARRDGAGVRAARAGEEREGELHEDGVEGRGPGFLLSGIYKATRRIRCCRYLPT